MKTVLITGAAKGIGAACAQLFARSGYAVAVNYNSSETESAGLVEAIKAAGGRAAAYKADITEERQVADMFKKIRGDFLRLDVLINNAGISGYKLFQDILLQEWNGMLSVNLTGAFLCAREAVKIFLEKKRGNIINISSVWGITGAATEVHYSSSKAGLIGMTKALAKELAPSNINVNCIAPGAIETDMIKSLTQAETAGLIEQTPLGRLGTPEDIAKIALFLASSDASFITGQVISPNGGFVI